MAQSKLENSKNNFILIIFMATFWLLALIHVILGASAAISFLAALTMSVATIPLIFFSIFDIPSLLLMATALRYIGISMIAKLIFLQPLDSNLDYPFESFLAVFIGTLSYLIARRINFKTSFLKELRMNNEIVKILCFLFLFSGIVANLISTLRRDNILAVSSFFNFFREFITLAMIFSVYLSIKKSHSQKNLSLLSILIFLLGLFFAFANSTRAIVRSIFLGWLGTAFAFQSRLNWRVVTYLIIFAIIIMQFLTPLILFTRLIRGETTWSERVQISISALSNWEAVQATYTDRYQLSQRSPHLNYYGSYQNVLERLSFIDHVDAVITGVKNINKHLGFAEIEMAFTRSLPRFIIPDKPPDNFGHGDWVLCELNIICSLGTFNTLQLIPCGFAALGWFGVVLYPIIFGTLSLLSIKIASGTSLYHNPWGVFIFILVNNTFSEGSTLSNIVFILRELPQFIVAIALFYIVSVFIYRYFKAGS